MRQAVLSLMFLHRNSGLLQSQRTNLWSRAT